MLYNANASQAIVLLNTGNSSPSFALAITHKYLSGTCWVKPSAIHQLNLIGSLCLTPVAIPDL
jgi:hypothetical protein